MSDALPFSSPAGWIRQLLASILLGALLGYLVLALVAFLFADRLLFPDVPTSYRDSRRIIKLELPGGEVISATYLPNPRARHTLLYSHGNGEDLGRVYPLLEYFRDFGFNVMAYDYPGYGTSTGKPSEANVYQSIDAVYRHLVDHMETDPQSIILYGRSLGAGPSLHLASREEVGAVVLEGAFTSAFRVFSPRRLLPWDKFDNLAAIADVDVPILFIHATDDEVVPFTHAEALKQAYQGPSRFFWVEGAGHNNLIEYAGQAYWGTLDDFVSYILAQQNLSTS